MINVSDKFLGISSIHKVVVNLSLMNMWELCFSSATQATQNSSYPNSTWLSAGYRDFQKSPSSDFIRRGTKVDRSRLRRSQSAASRRIGHFTVMDESEANGALVLIQTFLLYYVNQVILMLTSIFKDNFHNKAKEVCIKTRSPSASHSPEG